MSNDLVALLYLAAGVLFILALRGLSSPETSRQGNRFGMLGMAIAIGTTLWLIAPDQTTWTIIGGAVLVESTAGLFLVSRTAANVFTAIEAVCTHEWCTITGTEGSVYVCPCHGSRYDRTGRVVAGPAQSALRQHATSVADGVVTIVL